MSDALEINLNKQAGQGSTIKEMHFKQPSSESLCSSSMLCPSSNWNQTNIQQMIKLNLKPKEYWKQKPATYDKQLDQIKNYQEPNPIAHTMNKAINFRKWCGPRHKFQVSKNIQGAAQKLLRVMKNLIYTKYLGSRLIGSLQQVISHIYSKINHQIKVIIIKAVKGTDIMVVN